VILPEVLISLLWGDTVQSRIHQ